jgi:hypothetical protein
MTAYDSDEYGRHVASGLVDDRVPGGTWIHVFRRGDEVNVVKTDTQDTASIAGVTIGNNPVVLLTMTTEGAVFLADVLGAAGLGGMES